MSELGGELQTTTHPHNTVTPETADPGAVSQQPSSTPVAPSAAFQQEPANPDLTGCFHPIFFVSVVSGVLGFVLLVTGAMQLDYSPRNPGFIALLVIGILLLVLALVFMLVVCITQRERLEAYRRKQQAKALVMNLIRQEKFQGRLFARISAEQFQALVSTAVQVPDCEREDRILAELRVIETNYRAMALPGESHPIPAVVFGTDNKPISYTTAHFPSATYTSTNPPPYPGQLPEQGQSHLPGQIPTSVAPDVTSPEATGEHVTPGQQQELLLLQPVVPYRQFRRH